MSDTRLALLEASHKNIESRFNDLNGQLERMATAIETLAIVSQRQEFFDTDLREFKKEYRSRNARIDPLIMDSEKAKASMLTTIRMTGAVVGFLQVVAISFGVWIGGEISDLRKNQYGLIARAEQAGTWNTSKHD